MNKENFEEAYIRANAQLAFIIAEGNRVTKRLKNQATGRVFSDEEARKRREERRFAPTDELPAHSSRRSFGGIDKIIAHSYRDVDYIPDPPVQGAGRGRKKVRGSKTGSNERSKTGSNERSKTGSNDR